jgi:glycosyltransferase involved in cell wall biosynthesis
MRIFHVNTERSWRGGEQQTLWLAKGLRDIGEESAVVAQPGSPLAERARAAALPVHEIRMRGEWDLAAVLALRRLYAEHEPDVCHMHTSHAHTLGCLARLGRRRPLTVVSRRVDFSIYRNFLRASWLKYRLLGDRFVAISRAVRDVLVDDGIPPDRIEVVPSGIETARLETATRKDLRDELGLAPGTPLVGNVAAFGWHKAQEVLVEATPLLLKEVPDAHVVFVGDGEFRGRVTELAQRLGEAGRAIHFTGFRNDVPQLLPCFDVFVMCSVKEGLCTSVLDAQAVGIPVVASAVGGLVEAVKDGETGLLVPARDPAALASAVARVFRDGDLRRKLGEAGRAHVRERFSVKTMVEGSRSVYGRMVRGEPVNLVAALRH